MSHSRTRRLLYELLQYRRASVEATEGFEGMRHNAHLCPALQATLEGALEVAGRFRKIAYDIQGPRDGGTDVLIRLGSEDEEEAVTFIGFQVKAADEVHREIYQLLKAQYVDAKNRFGNSLREYYIVLCWPMKEFHTQIREVENAFAGIEDVYVIEPPFAWTFLKQLTDIEVGAVAAAVLTKDDPLVQAARDSLISRSVTQQFIVLELLVAQIDGEATRLADLANDAGLQDAYASMALRELDYDVPLPPGTVVPASLMRSSPEGVPSAADLDHLEDLVYLEDDVLHLAGDDLVALRALAYDARARYGYERADLVEHLKTLLAFVPLESASDEGRAVAIAEAILYADLQDDTKLEILGELLEANFGTPSECASEAWGEPEDPAEYDAMTWKDLAAELLYHVDPWANDDDEDEDEEDEPW